MISLHMVVSIYFETPMTANVYKFLLLRMEENLNLLSVRNFKNLTLYSFSPTILFILWYDVSQILHLWKLHRVGHSSELPSLHFPSAIQTWQIGYYASQT